MFAYIASSILKNQFGKELNFFSRLCLASFLGTLTSFIEDVHRFSLPRLQTGLAAGLLAEQPGVFIDHQMKPKKSHEVELLAALAAQMAHLCQLEQVR